MQKIAEESSYIHVLISKKDRERLERIAKRQKRGQETKLGDVARKMLLFGIDVYEDFERVGMVRVVEVFQRAKEGLRENTGPRQLTILDTKK